MKVSWKSILLLICLLAYILIGVVFDTIEKKDIITQEKYELHLDSYSEGIASAQEQISVLVEFAIEDLEYEIEDIYGVKAEEAIQILENYADNEPVAESELRNAIWAVSTYYSRVTRISNEIEDYWLE
jgi:uncharacterized protein YpmS